MKRRTEQNSIPLWDLMDYRPKGNMVTWSSFGNQREACNTANTVRGLALALRVLVSDWLGKSNSRRYKNISRFLPQPPKRIVCRRDYICVVRSRPLTGTTVDCGEKPKCAIYDSSAVDVSSWWWGWGNANVSVYALGFWGLLLQNCWQVQTAQQWNVIDLS